MDQHPIPQNVTGFQFKLIGAMTVKQFGYVALGVIAAVIVYYLPVKGLFGVLLKTILLPLFGASGAIIAFLPIDGRPIDVMAGNFLKALFSPNQYVYHKTGVQFSFSKIASPKPVAKHAVKSGNATSVSKEAKQATSKGAELQKILSKSSAGKANNPQDIREAAFLKAFAQNAATASSPTPVLTASPLKQHTAPALPPLPTPAPKKAPQPEVLSEKETALKKQLEFAKQEEASQHTPQELTLLHQKTVALEQQVAQIHSQKQALENEIKSLKSQLLIQQAPTPTITATKPTEKPTSPPKVVQAAHVRSVPREMNKKMGLLVSDEPNVVSGVVKDPRGNVLPNILVEIKDKSDNPVRAFKTNTLGNFASATPLPPGTYTITLEDPKKLQTFDEIQITVANQIILPIEIISYDKREQLRQELFN